MVAAQFLVAGLIATASATSLVAREDAYFASLLKRQQPGTPSYNCHDNCGTAITLSRGADPCTNANFISGYNNCLKCSGPDNYNIWRYYGGSLSAAGSKCNLPTQPLSGKQEDVPPAAGSGGPGAGPPGTNPQTSSAAVTQSSSAAPEVPASSTAVVSTSNQAPVTSTPATSEALVSSDATPSSGTSSAATSSAGTSSAATLSAGSSSAATSSALRTTVVTRATSSAPFYPTVIANGTLSYSVSGAPSPSTNGSASFTSSAPAQATTNAAAGLRAADAAGMVGAVFLGAFLGM